MGALAAFLGFQHSPTPCGFRTTTTSPAPSCAAPALEWPWHRPLAGGEVGTRRLMPSSDRHRAANRRRWARGHRTNWCLALVSGHSWCFGLGVFHRCSGVRCRMPVTCPSYVYSGQLPSCELVLTSIEDLIREQAVRSRLLLAKRAAATCPEASAFVRPPSCSQPDSTIGAARAPGAGELCLGLVLAESMQQKRRDGLVGGPV